MPHRQRQPHIQRSASIQPNSQSVSAVAIVTTRVRSLHACANGSQLGTNLGDANPAQVLASLQQQKFSRHYYDSL
jgi:hypothetical protein